MGRHRRTEEAIGAERVAVSREGMVEGGLEAEATPRVEVTQVETRWSGW